MLGKCGLPVPIHQVCRGTRLAEWVRWRSAKIVRLSTKATVRGLVVIGLAALTESSMCDTIQAQKKQSSTASPKIIECIKNGDVACTSEFLATGGNANAVDEKGASLLITATETKSATVVRLLLNA